MCLIALRWRHGGERLLLASNRDEFHDRGTDAAGWWPPEASGGRRIWGGRDRLSGGGWLALRPDGRFAAVTNVRRMLTPDPAAPSRGGLVAGFLRGDDSAADFASSLYDDAPRYAGFNLLLGDGDALWYVSNQDGFESRPLAPGLHTLSNAWLDTPWPKTERLREALADPGADDESLFAALADDRPAPDDALPDTGVGMVAERMLSPPFIRGAHYGTRASTLLRIGDDGGIHFEERRFGPGGTPQGRQSKRLDEA